jgi:hypothetical protein
LNILYVSMKLNFISSFIYLRIRIFTNLQITNIGYSYIRKDL